MMKLLILLIALVLLVAQNEAAVVVSPDSLIGIEVDVGKISVPINPIPVPIDPIPIGPIPIDPNPIDPGTCGTNEVWSCGYCDAACFEQLCCLTPPCINK